MKKIKKLLSLALASAVVLTFGAFAGCNNNQSSLSFETAYETSALGAIGILESVNAKDNGGSNQGLAVVKAISAEQEQEIVKNLAIVQNTLKGGAIKSEVKESTREGFEKYYTLTATDLSGVEKVYEFYYNETSGRERGETRMDGVVILDGVEYTMVGEKEVEWGEQELSFLVKIDNSNCVEIEQEDEGGEREFSYTVIKNGVEVYETEVEYEKTKSGRTIIKFGTETPDGEKKYAFRFYTENGENFVKVVIEEENGRIEDRVLALIKIIVNADQTVTYQFINTASQSVL